MKQFTFRKEERLHFDKEFRRIFKKGIALRNSGILMFAYKRNEPAESKIKNTRLGLVISRKAGRAVDRNRLKRQLREIFRLNKHTLKQDFDIVFMAKEKLASFKYDRLQNIVFNLWQRAKVLEQQGTL
ncbi:MAG: ribonuclease P protein component [Elusimicrobia bacterium]|nr:ribonuclease P protein component [Elusimicrobiota bacterium]MBU2614905.1 ribonuclease P protein component [Elusimicrobiota bacterium]